MFCVTEKSVDTEGYSLVTEGPKPKQPHLGDFIRHSTGPGHSALRGSTNRHRPLSQTEWQEIATYVRSESHKEDMVQFVPPALPAISSSLFSSVTQLL